MEETRAYHLRLFKQSEMAGAGCLLRSSRTIITQVTLWDLCHYPCYCMTSSCNWAQNGWTQLSSKLSFYLSRKLKDLTYNGDQNILDKISNNFGILKENKWSLGKGPKKLRAEGQLEGGGWRAEGRAPNVPSISTGAFFSCGPELVSQFTQSGICLMPFWGPEI